MIEGSGDDFGGLFDNVREARVWKPILPLLRATREAGSVPAKLAAIRAVAAFFLQTSYQADPNRIPAFRVFALFVELAQTDERVRRLAEEMLSPGDGPKSVA